MNAEKILELAKRGEVGAISYLLNHSLKPKGITAKVILEQDCLQVVLEADHVPSTNWGNLVHRGLLKLEISSIRQASVYGRQTDEKTPAWHQAFDLSDAFSLPHPSPNASTQDELHQVGDTIADRYRILHLLGQGGVGITYEAEDLQTQERVALKTLSLRHMGAWKQMELFEREAKVLAQLRHPAIPRYRDYFTVDTPDDRAFYIVQDLAEGKSLAELVESGWRTNEAGVKQIAIQILRVLVYLQSLKPPVFHRDIKPHNLIRGENGRIYLVDFGAVRDTYRSTLAGGSTVVGTFGYMPPEQFRGEAFPATDLYGLGATLLFLLTHRHPSELPQERLKISFRSRLQVSDRFANWLEKVLEPDVDDRFPSAKVAIDVLEAKPQSAAKPRPLVLRRFLVSTAISAILGIFILDNYGWGILIRPRDQVEMSVSPSSQKRLIAQSSDINIGDNINIENSNSNDKESTSSNKTILVTHSSKGLIKSPSPNKTILVTHSSKGLIKSPIFNTMNNNGQTFIGSCLSNNNVARSNKNGFSTYSSQQYNRFQPGSVNCSNNSVVGSRQVTSSTPYTGRYNCIQSDPINCSDNSVVGSRQVTSSTPYTGQHNCFQPTSFNCSNNSVGIPNQNTFPNTRSGQDDHLP